MKISDLLVADRIVCGGVVSSKKRALEKLAGLLASTDISSETDIYNSLIARERLGSTGLGHGVAIPHGRLKDIATAIGVFVKLDEKIDFDAVDGEPVDLIFALIVPQNSTEEHLQLLAGLAEMFGDSAVRERLRQTKSAAEIEVIINNWRPAEQELASS